MLRTEDQFIEKLLKDYRVLTKPKDTNATIWRYIDFTKFISLLQKRKMFFPKAVSLQDPFEGATTKANIFIRKSNYPHISSDIFKGTMKHMEVIKESIYVNCWNISEEETNLMWASYVEENSGVAIQSTFKRLKSCFHTNSNLKIRIGKVKYIDYYKTDNFNELVGYLYFLHKRKIYKYENELRAMTLLMGHQKNKALEEDFTDKGIFVPINLDMLVEKVVVSPNAKIWQVNLVESLMEEYGVIKIVEQSSIYKAPHY